MLICRNWIDTLEDDYTSCGQGMFRLVVCWRFGPKTILSSESRRGSEINELRSSGQRSGPRRVCEPWGQQYPIDSTSRGAARFFRRSAARRPLGASTQGSQTRLGPERCPLLRSSLISDPRRLSLLRIVACDPRWLPLLRTMASTAKK